MLFIIIGVVLVLLIVAGAGFFILSKKHASTEEEAEAPAPTPKVAAKAEHATPPAYLPMDTMVVNLADPGGERVAQIGVSLVVADAHASDTVKAYLPAIRSGVLLLVSQRTADELLQPEGKEKLAEAILREASLPFGGGEEEEEESSKKKKKKKVVHVEYPVTDVLFTSFIVQ